MTLHFSTARREAVVSTVSTNGKVEPVEWAAARAERSPAFVRSVLVQRGQQVGSPARPLVVLDATSARTDLEAALAKEREAQRGSCDSVR